MKKLITILFILLSINTGFCANSNSALFDKIENSIYGFTYSSEDEVSRLSRLEKSIYGESKKDKSINERITAIKRDMSADLIGQEITPKEDTFAEEQDLYKEELAQETMPPAAANVDYPSINELERKIFKQEFKTKDLNSRLANLEKESLGKTFETEPFASRVERLQAKIKPNSFMNNSIAQSSNNYYDGDIVELDKDYHLDSYSSPDFDYESYNSRNIKPQRVNLASVEKSLFKTTFNNDNIDNRLTRLESTMFGTTFAEDTQDERISRISSAFNAQKSANKYDSNKFGQNMSTAMQIGSILLMILACIL